uniref:GOLD domain-containing protein n=1 Tax=Wuchereria bancrofti TaxID=6293 RepID=A0AAF5PJ67_WUCBA
MRSVIIKKSSVKINLSMASAGYGDYLFCFDNTFSIQSDKRGHFLGGFDQQINVGTEVLRTLDTHVGHFQVYVVRSLFEENSRIGLILRKGHLND